MSGAKELEQLLQVLKLAEGAVLDAIGHEDGLDGAAGYLVLQEIWPLLQTHGVVRVATSEMAAWCAGQYAVDRPKGPVSIENKRLRDYADKLVSVLPGDTLPHDLELLKVDNERLRDERDKWLKLSQQLQIEQMKKVSDTTYGEHLLKYNGELIRKTDKLLVEIERLQKLLDKFRPKQPDQVCGHCKGTGREGPLMIGAQRERCPGCVGLGYIWSEEAVEAAEAAGGD